ncbi:hypothetical protein D3C77_342430 [compost metagenome]
MEGEIIRLDWIGLREQELLHRAVGENVLAVCDNLLCLWIKNDDVIQIVSGKMLHDLLQSLNLVSPQTPQAPNIVRGPAVDFIGNAVRRR